MGGKALGSKRVVCIVASLKRNKKRRGLGFTICNWKRESEGHKQQTGKTSRIDCRWSIQKQEEKNGQLDKTDLLQKVHGGALAGEMEAPPQSTLIESGIGFVAPRALPRKRVK